jgi:hypothetical protein
MSTLVAVRHFEIAGTVFTHGCEIMPGRFSKEVVNQLIDQGVVKEYDTADRRSLYRLFPMFSGCEEKEPLTQAELTAYALTS